MANTNIPSGYEKISPDDPQLDLQRPRSRRLKKLPIILLLAAVGCLLASTLYFALRPKPSMAVSSAPVHIDPESVKRAIPDALRLVAGDYAKPQADTPALGPPLSGDLGGFQIKPPTVATLPPVQAQPLPTYQPPPPPKPPSPEELEKQRLALERQRQAQLAREAKEKALQSGIFFANAGVQATPQGFGTPSVSAAGFAKPAATPVGYKDIDGASDPMPQLGDGYLKSHIQAARSPYEVKAGSIIPIVLLTAINSDLPGQIMAQVRENVFDTVSGRYLLIPQGTRVIGQYDANLRYGQERALVVWSRLIFQDGSTLGLEGMPGIDGIGQAGYSAEVDHHWQRLVSGVLLSSLLAGTAGVNSSQDGFAGRFYENVGMGINRAGQEITQRNLDVKPTVRIPPGYSTNILVHRDMVLKPFPVAPVEPLDQIFFNPQ